MATSIGKIRPRRASAQGSVDAIAGHRLGGWAAAPGGVKVEFWLDGQCIGSAVPSIPRPDVAAAFPKLTRAATSGFTFDLPPNPNGAGLTALQVIAKPARPWVRQRVLCSTTRAGSDLYERLEFPKPSGIVGPFPAPVIDTLAVCWPEACVNLTEESGQLAFLDRLQLLMETPEINSLPALADYARYLKATHAHCRFVERHFPNSNDLSEENATDFHCKPNSVHELFSIINQIFVLKSFGVPGDFAEFGCFKGYSSAMLSFACLLLGIRMHVYDSFAGLPAAEGSSYGAGAFAGGIDEVRENIRRFGALDTVEFHPGFFADSLVNRPPSPIMCLWMDVDLAVSARDLLVVAEDVDPRGSLFSHECPAQIFHGDAIVTEPGPDNPIPPLLERFAAIGRPLRGHHIAGYTGAFWSRENGIPALTTKAVQRVLDLSA